MTIDEAIEHAEEVARTCDDSQCANDHAQLADWLRELRRARMKIDLLKTLRDGFKADAQMYMAENAKLRELVRILHMAYVGATNESERMDEALICEFSDSILKDLEKSRAKYEADRHRFDAAMRALEIEVPHD